MIDGYGLFKWGVLFSFNNLIKQNTAFKYIHLGE